MSLAAVKIRATSAPKTSTSLTLTRSRSTVATNPSFLEARARVKERARNISRSSAHNALVTPTVYVSFSSVLLTYSSCLQSSNSHAFLPAVALKNQCPKSDALHPPRHCFGRFFPRHVRRSNSPRDDASTRRQANVWIPRWRNLSCSRRNP